MVNENECDCDSADTIKRTDVAARTSAILCATLVNTQCRYHLTRHCCSIAPSSKLDNLSRY